MGKLYWKEGERNKHDTVQSNWAGTVMLGTGAMQIAHALDGEATKNQLAGAAIFWGLSIPEFMLGTGAMQIAHALDGEATKNRPRWAPPSDDWGLARFSLFAQRRADAMDG